MDAASGDLKGVTADMHDYTLNTADENVDEHEGIVVKDASENVEGIVYDSRIDQVEDAHHHKYIEHIGKMARCSMLIISIDVNFCVYRILFRVSISISS